MKRLFLLFCSILFVFIGVGSAKAVPMVWTDTMNLDVLVPPAMSYFHDISDGDNGFVSEQMGGNDTIDSFDLQVSLYDDDADDAVWEIVRWERCGFVTYPVFEEVYYPDGDESGLLTTFSLQPMSIGLGTNTYDGQLGGKVDLYHDGTLNILISAVEGDFYVGSSTLTVYGDNGDNGSLGTASVPEPGMMLLIGTGFVGLACFSRRKILS